MLKISDAELEVLKVFWEQDVVTSNDIIAALRDYPWSSNTIRTLIKRLHKKGAIEITGKVGKSYTYKVTLDEGKFKSELTLDLLKKFYDGSLNKFIAENFDESMRDQLVELQKSLEEIIRKRYKKSDC